MRFVKIPNLPEADAGLAAVSDTYPGVIRALEKLGLEVVPVPPKTSLSGAVQSHADMLCHPLGGARVVVARGESVLRSRLERYGFLVTESVSRIESPYPGDARLNAARVGNRLIANPAVLDRTIAESCKENAIGLVPVRQGYAKCSAAVVDGNSILTSDEGIAAAASAAGLDVLKIRPGFIELPGFPYGFLGGTCGMIGRKLLAFAGDVRSHPDYPKIKAWLEPKGVRTISLCGRPLLDIGGILPLMEKSP